MTLLAVRNLFKAYGAIHVLNDISFVINTNDRVGIVGSNGVGKSTLLKMLVGQEELDKIAAHYIYVDHDQTRTFSGGAHYHFGDSQLSGDFLYGSGLRFGGLLGLMQKLTGR